MLVSLPSNDNLVDLFRLSLSNCRFNCNRIRALQHRTQKSSIVLNSYFLQELKITNFLLTLALSDIMLHTFCNNSRATLSFPSTQLSAILHSSCNIFIARSSKVALSSVATHLKPRDKSFPDFSVTWCPITLR